MMAEFSEVMKQYKRLLVAHNSGEETPIDVHYPCMMENTEHFEKTVMAWAAENPEPVYPTWGEWLHDKGIILDACQHNEIEHWILGLNAIKPIPADIAKKLGIEPKEG